MGKIEAGTTGSLIKCPRTHLANRTGEGQRLGPRTLHPASQAPFPRQPPLLLCVLGSAPHPRTPPLRPWHLERPGRSRHARGPPAPPPTRAFSEFLRAEPGPGWGRGAHRPPGHRREGGSSLGGMRPHCPTCPFPTRPPAAKNRASNA